MSILKQLFPYNVLWKYQIPPLGPFYIYIELLKNKSKKRDSNPQH